MRMLWHDFPQKNHNFINQLITQQLWDLRCGVQADAVGLCGWRWLVIGGEDRQAGWCMDNMIDQVANGRRA